MTWAPISLDPHELPPDKNIGPQLCSGTTHCHELLVEMPSPESEPNHRLSQSPAPHATLDFQNQRSARGSPLILLGDPCRLVQPKTMEARCGSTPWAAASVLNRARASGNVSQRLKRSPLNSQSFRTSNPRKHLFLLPSVYL